jgi:hypothetical protein
MTKTLPRCVMRAKDGSQCARRVSDGSYPPTCHIHAAKQRGTSISPLTQPVELDEMEILRKLARSGSEQVQLRAVDLLLSLRKEGTDAPKQNVEDLTWLERATDAQRERLRDLVAEIATIKAQCVRQPLPDPEPIGDDDERPDEREHQEQPEPDQRQVSVASDPSADAEPGGNQRKDRPEELTPAQRRELGFVRLNPGGPWIHPLGDEHAAKILSGEISLEEARAEQQAAIADFEGTRHLVTTKPRYRGSL